VEQRVLEQVTIAPDDEVRRAIEYHLDSWLQLESANQLLDQPAKRDLLTPRVLFPRLGTREHEQRRGEPIEAAGLLLDVAQKPVALLRDLARSGLEALDRTSNGRQRRPQLVSGIVDELALGAPPMLAIGDVSHDEEHRLRVSRWDPR